MEENTNTVSKNFIEQLIDKDLAEGVLRSCADTFSAGAEWIPAYRPCEIYSVEFRAGEGVQWQVQSAF